MIYRNFAAMVVVGAIVVSGLFCLGSNFAKRDQPDLKIAGFSASYQGEPGQQISFQFSVYNIGQAASNSCYYGVYISKGAYWTGNRIASGTIYALETGQSDNFSGGGYIPDDLEPDYYYLYAVADDGEYEDDSDRSNNVAYLSFEVVQEVEH